MRFSVEWLRELSGVKRPVAELAEALTRVGLAVDSIEGEADDAVLDVDVPSNRPDCLGHLGLARELAAALGLRLPAAPPAPHPAASGAAPLPVHIEDPSLCARYSARLVRQVRAGPSPEWVRQRLERSGVRPRNVIVDITNYVLLETGQPLHAFDFERLQGGRLSVRRARAGESIVTLDGARHELGPEHLVIADAARPVALAGVMGGLDTEIRDNTRTVVIESARFDPLAVRRTARSLGLRTEGSQRFERGTDPECTLACAQRAAELVARLAGGVPHPQAVDLYPGSRPPRCLRLRRERVAALLGTDIGCAEAGAILDRLGFRALRQSEVELEVEVPSFRADVSCEEDLIEEVARHWGYERIPSTLPPAPETAAAPEQDPLEHLATALSTLHAHGFTEAICTVFVHGRENSLFADGDGAAVRLLNPLSETGDELRRSLLPGLLGAVRRNLNHGARGVALYETGVVFRGGSPPEEEPRLALAAAGTPSPEIWDRPARAADLFDLKGALEEALERSGWPALRADPAAAEYLHPGRAARLSCAGRGIGLLGELHPDAARALDLGPGVVVAEVSLAELARVPTAPRRFQPFARTPAISRDLALVVPRQQSFAALAEAVRSFDPRIARVELFDRYESERLGPAHVGLALHVIYHHPERTLVSEEVQELENRILLHLRERFGITLRGS